MTFGRFVAKKKIEKDEIITMKKCQKKEKY